MRPLIWTPVQAAKFKDVYSRYREPVLRYLLRRVRNPVVAEDLAAETFLIAWRRFDVVPEEPLAWLLETARRLLANHRRTQSRRQQPRPLGVQTADPPGSSSEDPAERIPEKQAFSGAFSQLSDDEREMLTLVAWDGLRPREAAEVLGITPEHFTLRVHRARRKLAKTIEQASAAPTETQEGRE